MKAISIAAASLLLLSACDKGDTTTDRTESTAGSSLESIAGDKTEMAELMRLAHDKGTLDDALALTMQDSAIAASVFDAVLTDDRFIAITAVGTPVSPSGTSPNSPTAPSSTQKKTTPSKTTPAKTTQQQTPPARNGDILDDAERTAQRARERLEQAERVKREAEAAKKKVEDILGR